MTFYPQYCEAAVLASAILLVMYFLKRNYRTTRNRIFLIMVVDNLLASIINILSVYILANPQKHSIHTLYFINELYYALYNYLAIIFILYVAVIVNSHAIRKYTQILAVFLFGTESLLIFTTHFTHFVFSFDENKVYSRNTGITVLYILAFSSLVVANVAIIFYRRLFNQYQVISVTGFMIGILASIIIQGFYPKYLITNLTLSMVMFFLYSAFENPAYYLYGDTQCFNRRAFIHTLKTLARKEEKYVIFTTHLKYEFQNDSTLSLIHSERLSYRAASNLQNSFRKKTYCYGFNSFAIIDSYDTDIQKSAEKIKAILNNPVETDVGQKIIKQKPLYYVKTIFIEDSSISESEMLQLLDTVTAEENEKVYNAEEVRRIIDKNRRKSQISKIIDKSLLEDQFEVYYQPIYEIKSEMFKGAEALLRLQNTELGFISPDEFIPIAETNGQIIEIGEMVLKKVCKFISDSELLSLNVEYIDVNLSPVQCRYENLGERYLSIIKEYMVETKRLNLEITETAQAETITADILKNMMDYLVKNGIDFSIDDYGSGFAGIDYLLEFPARTVKIDKSILWYAMKNREAMVILEHTIHLLKAIGKKIVVEGVEDIVMRDLLIGMGCDYLQGYLFSKPVPEQEYLEFLRSQNSQTNKTEA